MTGKKIGKRNYVTWPGVGLGFALVIVMTGESGPSAMADSPVPTGVVAAVEDRTVEITPDDTFQAALADLFNAPDKAVFSRQADQLLALRAGDSKQLVAQLLWFAAQHHQDARTKAFVGNVLVRLSAPKHIIVAALAPQLDNRDETVRGMAQELLKSYEDRSATRVPDFSLYRALIEADVRAGREPQTSLVRFMYESEPGVALQAMVRAYQLREPEEIKTILWAEHVVAELLWKRRYGFVERKAVDAAAVQELEKLTRQPQWWVRLYVAEIVLAHPELGPADVVKRLQEDIDPRVRGSMQRAIANTAGDSGKK